MAETKSKIEKQILKNFSPNADITTRVFKAGEKEIYLFFIDCLVNKELIASGIIGTINNLNQNPNISSKTKIIDLLESQVISASTIKKIKEPKQIQEEIFNGSVIVVAKNEEEMLAINAAGFSKRSITEPPTSNVIRGPREGFIEDLEVNLSMVRRRLKTPSLAVKRLKVGVRTQTNIAILYLDGVVNPNLVKKIEKSIKEIDIDGVLDSYYLEELLEKSGEKFFKRFGNTEKPDVAVSRILEGRVAIIVDGSPMTISAPFILFEDMQSPGDYYEISMRTSFVRFVRLIGLLLAILLPGTYVALQSYHYKVLPINFLISLLSSIEGISFPPILEILFVLFLFEILNEASIRMPKQLGMALSIIGALILGDTAVQAGIITPPSIVVVAISGITLYIIPNQSNEANLLRTLFTIIGGVAGFYGIFLCFLVLSGYLVSLSSFNAPYMAPYAPSIATDKKDGFIKKPLNNMVYRPKSFKTLNSIRFQPRDKSPIRTKDKNKQKIMEKEKATSGGKGQ